MEKCQQHEAEMEQAASRAHHHDQMKHNERQFESVNQGHQHVEQIHNELDNLAASHTHEPAMQRLRESVSPERSVRDLDRSLAVH